MESEIVQAFTCCDELCCEVVIVINRPMAYGLQLMNTLNSKSQKVTIL